MHDWATYGYPSYVLYSDEGKIKLFKVVQMEEVMLPRTCIFFGQKNVHRAGGDEK